jgi:hypothetical protein
MELADIPEPVRGEPARDYKVETKPTYWWVQLSHGAYSDYEENNYFIHANDHDEAWHLFKRYWDQTPPSGIPIWRRFNTMLKYGEEIFKPRWSAEEDDLDAWDVEIEQLDVIEFAK